MALKGVRSGHERPLHVIETSGRRVFASAHGIELARARHTLVLDDLGGDLARLQEAQFVDGATEGHAMSLG